MDPQIKAELVKTARHLLKLAAFLGATYIIVEVLVMWAKS